MTSSVRRPTCTARRRLRRESRDSRIQRRSTEGIRKHRIHARLPRRRHRLTRTLGDLRRRGHPAIHAGAWNGILLGPDIATAIQDLKGKDLIKYGSTRLDATLVRARLVDELRLWVMPVVVGAGQRLFDDVDTSTLELALTDVRKLANSAIVLTYTPNYRS